VIQESYMYAYMHVWIKINISMIVCIPYAYKEFKMKVMDFFY
jgi:hypothetical protein